MNQTVLEAKQSVVAEIVAKAKSAQSVTIVEYRGLSVANLQELRRTLRKDGAELCIYKNSLVERAVKELGYEGVDEYLSGPNAIVFSTELSNGPKIVTKYAKRHEELQVKGGIVDGKGLNKAQIIEVGKIPGKEGLLSMFLSCLQAPIRQFAATVKAVADAK